MMPALRSFSEGENNAYKKEAAFAASLLWLKLEPIYQLIPILFS